MSNSEATAYHFHAQQKPSGWWFISSPDVCGLLASGPTLHDALSEVSRCIADLHEVQSFNSVEELMKDLHDD